MVDIAGFVDDHHAFFQGLGQWDKMLTLDTGLGVSGLIAIRRPSEDRF